MSLVTEVVDGAVATITMNDERRRNALSAGMRVALLASFESMTARSDVRAIVLTGAGSHFSSGGDIGAMPPPSREDADLRLEEIAALVRIVSGSAIPTVAAVDGFAAGVGVGLAAACDIVLITARAQVLFPFTRLGLLPDGGSLASVAHRVGSAQARRLFLQAAPVSGPDAVRMGLADELVADGELSSRAESVARDLGTRAQLPVHAIKRFYAAGDVTIDGALRAEAKHQPDMYFSADFIEGKQAFLERRDPRFDVQAH